MLGIVLCWMLTGGAEASQQPAEREPTCVSADANVGVQVFHDETGEVRFDERLVVNLSCRTVAAERAWTSAREAVAEACQDELDPALCRAIVAELPGGPGGANVEGGELACKHRVRKRTEGVQDAHGRPLREIERRDDLKCKARDGSRVRIRVEKTERTRPSD